MTRRWRALRPPSRQPARQLPGLVPRSPPPAWQRHQAFSLFCSRLRRWFAASVSSWLWELETLPARQQSLAPPRYASSLPKRAVDMAVAHPQRVLGVGLALAVIGWGLGTQ